MSIDSFILILFSKNRKLARKLVPVLGFAPTRIRFYEMAFIHKSASMVLPNGELINNERLEYLGDAILDAIVADFLFETFPHKDEGFLTKMRSRLVKRKHLNLLAYRMGLDRLIVSHTQSNNITKHLYGNAFEAMVGAVYLDKGYRKTRKYIVGIIRKYVDINKLGSRDSDYKSKLIEWAQKSKIEVVFHSHEDAPNLHNLPVFITQIMVMDQEMGRGQGGSKKESEQKAARNALEKILQN